MRQLLHIAVIVAVSWLPATVLGQTLTPLGDPVQEPLLPTGISPGEVEIFGQRVYLFKEADGAEAIHVVGDFELHVGRRRHLAAREAIIWMTPQRYGDINYNRFEVYLRHGARVTETAGTVTSGPVLFVILNNRGKVTIGADDTTSTPTADRAVYQEAAQARALAAAGQFGDVESQPPLRVLDLERARRADEPIVRPFFYVDAERFAAEEIEDRQVVTAIGRVRLVQDVGRDDSPLELRADAAVLFMLPSASDSLVPADEPVQEPPRDLLGDSEEPAVRIEGLGGLETGGGEGVEGIYLEGDVVLTRGERVIRASKLYYDLANDRALILDAVAWAIEPTREVPIYVRAERIRQLSRTEYAAWDALISTSEFHTPHYHIGAKEARFTDQTSRSRAGVRAGLRAGTYETWHTTFNLGGVPLAYWPYARGDFKEGETTIRGIRTGYSSNFGGEFETEWHLFNMLGLERPVGYDGTLRLDYFTDRGPATGVDLDYQRDDYFGLFRSYYIYDDGMDTLGRFRNEEPDSKNRGRILLRHRHYLPHDWQLTLETSYLTDRGFLEEYFEQEFEEGKEQETAFYLKKQQDTWALTGLAQWRILDWVTQTEHLPEFAFHMIGQSLADRVTYFTENRAGFVRYRPGERDLLEYVFLRPREDSSGTVARADTRHELEFPFSLGPVKIVPFASVRGTAWDDSPASGGLDRAFGTAGVRSSLYLSRVFPDMRSQILDIDGIRHIIKADVTAWAAGSSLDSNRLYPFTANIEDIDDISGVTAGIRQRWQTHRGGPGRRRTVDLLTLDLELGLFDNAQKWEETNGFTSYSRPENSISRNYVNAAVNYRVNDATSFLSEANVDLNDGSLEIFNVSLVVEREPRFSHALGYRFIDETDSSLLLYGANYRISEKHTIALREYFDLDRGKTEEFTIGFIRKFPRWYVSLSVDLDEADDDFGVSMSAWPEGLPRAALGSRRFTGLSHSTGIRPE